MKTLITCVFVVCLTASPALAQDWGRDWNPYYPDYQASSPAGSDNPALDAELERLDREQWRATMRTLEENAQQEMMSRYGRAACATIWNNPAAAQHCREHQGGW